MKHHISRKAELLTVRRHGRRVRHRLLASAAVARERARDGEDGVPLLPRLHCPRAERAALAHALHVVEDRDARVARQYEEAVVRVHCEVRGYGALRCLEVGKILARDQSVGYFLATYGSTSGSSFLCIELVVLSDGGQT